ncbi:MAG: PfkB family carbohydrate kinase [archaeon YNP-WB-040]|nr:PfkB family carbohydrate kinase [Candidatus Culexarchaeum yellowstonense]
MTSLLYVIGHLTIDEIMRGGRLIKRIGGTAYYSCISAKLLGWNCKLISKVGRDFPEDYLKHLNLIGLDISGVKFSDFPTTSFKLRYDDGKRFLSLKSRCEDIFIDDVREVVGDSIIHVGSVIGEVSSEIVDYISSRARMVSIDLQGFLRFFDSEGSIKLVKPIFIDELLGRVDVVHCDGVEASMATGIKDPVEAGMYMCNTYNVIVLLTLGGEGGYIFHDGEAYHIPSIVKYVVEETGAGDIYTSAFLYRYSSTGKLLESAIYASSVTSVYVESGDIFRLGNLDLINLKMNELWKYVKPLPP